MAGGFLGTLTTRLPLQGRPLSYDTLLRNPHCDHCGHILRWRDLIPLYSYFRLQGRCAFCKASIAKSYPLLELAAGFVPVVAMLATESLAELIALSILGWLLLAITVIDLKTRVIANVLTQTLLWLGLLVNLNGMFTPLHDAVVGILVGYASLWLLHHLFRTLTTKTLLGHDDFKMFAMCGAWVGWGQLSWLLMLTAVLLFLFWGIQMLRGRAQQLMGFSPAISSALFLLLLWPELPHRLDDVMILR